MVASLRGLMVVGYQQDRNALTPVVPLMRFFRPDGAKWTWWLNDSDEGFEPAGRILSGGGPTQTYTSIEEDESEETGTE